MIHRSRLHLLRAASAVLFFAIVPSATVSANDLSANDILVPVTARTPGAQGSVWRTDLTVTNVSRMTTAGVVITFSDGDTESFVTRTLLPRQTVVLDDVLFNTFSADNTVGIIRITSATSGAKLTANARVYNRGSASGEFGQGVQALPVDGLTRDHYLTGLSGLNGNRTNVGISNPWDIPVGFSIGLHDSDGEFRGSFTTVVGAKQVMQFNDVFSQFSSGPLEGATIHIVSEFGVYAYASVVRSDSGDARFVQGTGFARGHDLLLATGCSYAAPVNLVSAGETATDRWIVQLIAEETDPAGRVAQLAGEYGFTPAAIFEETKMFVAELTPEQIAQLRCDTAVTSIQQDHVVPVS